MNERKIKASDFRREQKRILRECRNISAAIAGLQDLLRQKQSLAAATGELADHHNPRAKRARAILNA